MAFSVLNAQRKRVAFPTQLNSLTLGLGPMCLTSRTILGPTYPERQEAIIVRQGWLSGFGGIPHSTYPGNCAVYFHGAAYLKCRVCALKRIG